MHLTPVRAVWKWGEPAPSPELDDSGQAFRHQQQNIYRYIHNKLSEVYSSETALSEAIDGMVETLEEA